MELNLPLQNGRIPSFRKIPGGQCLIISLRFWTKSLTRSMGAAAVLETAAATPESMKFSKKPNFFLSAIMNL